MHAFLHLVYGLDALERKASPSLYLCASCAPTSFLPFRNTPPVQVTCSSTQACAAGMSIFTSTVSATTADFKRLRITSGGYPRTNDGWMWRMRLGSGVFYY